MLSPNSHPLPDSHQILHTWLRPPYLPPASYLDNPLISHRGVFNIIFTFAKYEQYLVYVVFIVERDGGYLFIDYFTA